MQRLELEWHQRAQWPRGSHYLWHPVEQTVWVWDNHVSYGVHEEPASGRVLRRRGHQVEVVAEGPNLDPTGRLNMWSLYSYQCLFFYDEELQAPVFLIQTYVEPEEHAQHGLVMLVWNGQSFAPRKILNGKKTNDYDSFGYDAHRRKLVHFVGTNDEEGALTVRELDASGAWQDVAGSWPDLGHGFSNGRLFAGYDAHACRLIVIDDSHRKTYQWTGTEFVPLADFPTHLSSPRSSAQLPDGRFVYAQRLRSTEDEVKVWALDGDGWKELAGVPVKQTCGLLYDREKQQCVLTLPSFADDVLNREYALVSGDGLEPRGAYMCPVSALPGMPGVYTAQAAGTHLLRCSRSAPLSLMAESKHVLELGFFAMKAGIVSVRHDGGLVEWDTGTLLSAPCEKMSKRSTSNIGFDERSDELLMVSGSVQGKTKLLQEVHLFAAGAWKKVSSTNAPAVQASRVAKDPRTGHWVVASGYDSRWNPNSFVWEFDGRTWKRFSNNCSALRYFFADQASTQLCAVDILGVIYVYQGGGMFQPRTQLELTGEYSYDAAARELWIVSGADIASASLATCLDEEMSGIASQSLNGPHDKAKEEDLVVPSRAAFLMKLSKTGEDQFGGLPKGVRAADWPRCKQCDGHMQFVASFEANPERLPLKSHAAISVFCCNRESCCETWDAYAGCNHVRLLNADVWAMPAMKKAPSSNEHPAPEVLSKYKLRYEQVLEFDPCIEGNADFPNEESKLGGYPSWLQGPNEPSCNVCSKPMRFALQIDENTDADLNFGQGVGYVFICEDEHEARFLWQR